MPLIVETCVAHHTGDRPEQQDRAELFAHPTRPGTMMAVLADGMGGHTGGALAAEQVMLKARQNFEAYHPDHGNPEELLEGIISDAHLTIRLTRFTSEMEPHSTAVALLLQRDRICWIHCGDSRLYHFRGSETVSRSRDHSLVEELLRRGRLDASEAQAHPRRNVLLSCLGSERDPQVELGAASVQAGDNFLLCSDGLWGHFSDEELGATIATASAREAARTLIDGARRRAAGGGDNISLVIIKVGGGQPAEAVAAGATL